MMINKQTASRNGSAILSTLFALVAFSAPALAESQTGMTTVSVRVERHSGILIPTSTNGFVPASYRPGADSLEQVTAFGNGAPKPVFSGEAHSKLAPAASRLSPVRTEVTVFEP